MKIEFEGDTQYIEVIESVVRDFVPTDQYSGKAVSTTHFQARILIDEVAKKHYYKCELSYYSSTGEFLGASKTESRKKRSITGEPRLISEVVDVPENTEIIKARFRQVEDYMASSNNIFIHLFLGFVVALLLHWLIHAIYR